MDQRRESEPSGPLVEKLFRREAGKLVASLARRLGPQNLELAEDAVQEAMIKALNHWSYRAIPDNPAGWLWRVAHNAALDRLRADTRRGRLAAEAELGRMTRTEPPEAQYQAEIGDDRLALIFACCHPDIAATARLPLTLKTACGFGVREIASALLVSAETIAQRLVRARRRLKAGGIEIRTPTPDELPARLPTVLETVYLLFSEGFEASEGDAILRRDLCEEAIELAVALAEHASTGCPESHALAALLLLQGARLDTRVDGNGDLVLLPDQDRWEWDRRRVSAGLRHLDKAGTGEQVSEYHALAGIAATHATAPDYERTDWRAICRYYDMLPATPVHQLNHAVAIAMADGAEAGLDRIRSIRDAPALTRYYLLPATQGELLRRLGRTTEAETEFRRAIELAPTEPVRRFLRRKLA